MCTAKPRCAHRAARRRRIPVEQLEIDLALRQIDAAQAHAHFVAHLPASSRPLADQAHAAALEFPIVAG
ncbi:MAG TPA: hypothetical protein VKP66_08680, partial [Steroidobacteraceae bacterium]|nr:hypothetical protein [Steroidobacteraceae bacterium]